MRARQAPRARAAPRRAPKKRLRFRARSRARTPRAVVEDLSKRREPMPGMSGAPPRASPARAAPAPPRPCLTLSRGAAIYFISPTERSVRQLIEDFAGPLQMYKRAHVFFSNRACAARRERLEWAP